MLLTVKELARQLGIKPSTLYAWAAQGKLPCLKLNGTVRFDAEEIKSWLESCRVRKSGQLPPLANPGSGKDVDSLLAAAKRAVYSRSHGETRSRSSPAGKEDGSGAQ